MNNFDSYTNAVELLKLWSTPEMWHDALLFHEIQDVISKLSRQSFAFTDREYLIAQSLTKGVIEAIFSALDKSDDFQTDELLSKLEEISKLHTFLNECRGFH